MITFVLDASIAATWCLRDELSDRTAHLLRRLVDEEALVPALWHFEFANVLVQAERRGRLSMADAEQYRTEMNALPIVTDAGTPSHLMADIVAIARDHRLTVYDAAYLEVAVRHGLPLATLDRALVTACGVEGVPVLP